MAPTCHAESNGSGCHSKHCPAVHCSSHARSQGRRLRFTAWMHVQSCNAIGSLQGQLGGGVASMLQGCGWATAGPQKELPSEVLFGGRRRQAIPLNAFLRSPAMTTVMVASLLNIGWAKQEGCELATSPPAPAGRAAGISRKRCAHNPKPASLAIRLASKHTHVPHLCSPAGPERWVSRDPARGMPTEACH